MYDPTTWFKSSNQLYGNPDLASTENDALTPEGQLAFQVPAQHDSPSHRLAEELTRVEPFWSAFGGWHRPQPVLEPAAYASLLYRLGFAEPGVRLIVYPHVLAGPAEVVEWMKGTLLTEEDVDKVEAAKIQSVKIRSPLTCELRQGCCAACYGRVATAIEAGGATGFGCRTRRDRRTAGGLRRSRPAAHGWRVVSFRCAIETRHQRVDR